MAVIDVTDASFASDVPRPTSRCWSTTGPTGAARAGKLSPIVEELSKTYGDRMVFAKLDTNTNPDVPMRQGVMALPTLQFFVKGEVVQSIQGGKTKAGLIKAIEGVLEG